MLFLFSGKSDRKIQTLPIKDTPIRVQAATHMMTTRNASCLAEFSLSPLFRRK